MSPKGLPKTDTPSIEALLYEAQKRGILPITSECTARCAFCSNRYNPPSCEVLNIGRRSLDEIKESLPWLQGAPGAIVIGESVTRINEGEPLCHPDFLKIVRLVREAYPGRAIKVTTNGMLLTPEVVSFLSEAGVTLTVSLNSVSKREIIMGDRDPEKTLASIASLKGKVEFDGSIVALPFLTGRLDIRQSVRFLKESGATTVRLLLPGFSARHPLYKTMPKDTWEEVRAMATELSARERIPVLADPPALNGLDARVEFVLPNSPAARAGIRPGDLVVKVSGKDVFSRKDAFQKAYEMENPVLTVLREGLIEYRLPKKRSSSPGFVMYDDLDPREYLNWERVSGVAKGRDVLVLTSKPAKKLIETALERRGLEARIVAVRSYFFGGNICVAGLLTVRDFLAAYRRAVQSRGEPSLVTLPARAFDPWGRDLEGVHYRVFSQETGVPVILAG